jgi:26S proteasome regulatory subunit N11
VQTTSNVSGVVQSSAGALVKKLWMLYYPLAIGHRIGEGEERMLACLSRKRWSDGLVLPRFDDEKDAAVVRAMSDLTVEYAAQVRKEDGTPPERLAVVRAGRTDAKKQLVEKAQVAMSANITHTVAF